MFEIGQDLPFRTEAGDHIRPRQHARNDLDRNLLVD